MVSKGSQTVTAQKKRGPAPTGKGTPVTVRLQPDALEALDRWIEKSTAKRRKLLDPDAKPFSRPEAIRAILLNVV
jgi:hypothetical protein